VVCTSALQGLQRYYRGSENHPKGKKSSYKGFLLAKKLTSKPSSSENFSEIAIQKLDLWPTDVFRPTDHNANAKFKAATDLLGDRYQKSLSNNLRFSPSTG